MTEKLIEVSIMQSQWRSEHWAVCFDDTRVAGPDAGPWRVDSFFKVPLSEFQAVVRAHER